MNYLITYQKSDGSILLRKIRSLYGLEIGKETSMGWKVLDIHYEYEGNYYTREAYMRKIYERQRNSKITIRKILAKRINAFLRKCLNKNEQYLRGM